MFVITLGMGNFDCTTEMNAHFKTHSRVEASITSPTSAPYLAKQLTYGSVPHTNTLQLPTLLRHSTARYIAHSS